MLAIPAYDEISQVKRQTKRTSPAGVLANSGFEMHLRNGQAVIAKRSKAGQFKILYFLKQKADVPKRLRMVEVTEQTVAERFSSVFNQTLQSIIS